MHPPNGFYNPPIPIVQVSNLDPLLRGLPRWGVWQRERDGEHVKKVAYRARFPFTKAKSNNPAHWTDLPTALRLLRRGRVFDGLAFAFFAEDGLVAVDV